MLSICVGAYLALHGLAFVWPARLWGVDMAAWAPPALSSAAALLALPLLVDPVRRRAAAATQSRLPDVWTTPGRTSALAAALALVLSTVSLAFSSAVHLLGDGQLILTNLERWHHLGHRFDEIQWTTNNAPLGTLVLFVAQRSVRAVGGGGLATARLVDLLFGVAWVFLAAHAARFFGREAAHRWMLLAFLLTGGWMAIFSGHVEVYAVVLPSVLAFLWAAGRAIRDGRFPWEAAGLLGVAITLHTQNVTLVPALGVAAAVGPRRGRVDRAVRALAAVVACAGTALLISYLITFDVTAYLSEPRAGNFYPLFAEPTFRHAYRLLSPAHFLDVVNELLLVAPVGVVGACLVPWGQVRRAGHLSESGFLAVAAAGPLLFLFLANPEIGAFRDWDTMAFTGIPLTLLVGALLVCGRRGSHAGIGWGLGGVAALHTALWIVGQTDAPRAEARFLSLLETAPVSRHARGYGWESAGTYFRQTGRNEDAGRAYERALEALPENSRLWTLAGECHLKAGRYGKAEEYFDRALELDAGNVAALAGTGATLENLGEWERAVAPLEKAVSLSPDYHTAWYNLSIALQKLGRSDEAERALLAAVEAGPDFAPAWLELGRSRGRRGDAAGARAALTRYLELAPSAPEAAAIRAALRANGPADPRP